MLGREWKNSHPAHLPTHPPGRVSHTGDPGGSEQPWGAVDGGLRKRKGQHCRGTFLLLCDLVTRVGTWALTQPLLWSPLTVGSVSWLQTHLPHITRFLRNSACAPAGSSFAGSGDRGVRGTRRQDAGDRVAQPKGPTAAAGHLSYWPWGVTF